MSGEHPVFVVDDDAATRGALGALLERATEADGIAAVAAALRGPAVVVFGPALADDAGLAAVADFLADRPAVGAILVTNELTTPLLQQALRAGFRDVLADPVDRAQLNDSVDRVATTLPGVTLPATAAPAADGPALAHMTTVFSTKGGAGKSVLATNVAVAIAQQTSKPVILVDADLQFGDVSVMLKLAPRHTIVDAVNAVDGLDTALLEDLLITHPASGVRVLSAPLEPAFADQITADDMMRVVNLLRQMATYVVVDTPAYFNDVVLALIEESDDVLLMAGMDIPNIKNVRIGLQTLRLLNTPMSKIHLVLNRSNSKVKLDISEVERTLQVDARSRIPSDVAVPQSVNKGIPIVIDAPKSGPARAISELVRDLVKAAAR